MSSSSELSDPSSFSDFSLEEQLNQRFYRRHDSDISYRTGSEELDADMDDIEIMIRCRNPPTSENEVEQYRNYLTAFLYYKSKLLEYWIKTEEYIKSGRAIADRNRALGVLEESTLSFELVEEYKIEFMKYLENLESRFNDSRYFEIVNVTKAFNYVAGLACLRKPQFATYADSNMYPLPNKVGLFGINTYLYAFINKVQILGVPLEHTEYDKNWDCPIVFLEHDIAHSQRLPSSDSKGFNYYRSFFYQVHEDYDLEYEEKCLLLITLWVDIHELIYHFFDAYRKSSEFVGRLLDIAIRQLFHNFDFEFFNVWHEYRKVILSWKNINSFLRTSLEISEEDPDNPEEQSRQKYRQLIEKFQQNPRGLSKEEMQKLYIVLSFWHGHVYFYKRHVDGPKDAYLAHMRKYMNFDGEFGE